MPAIDELPQLSPAYMENSRWMVEHFAKLVQRHPNQWIAVHDNAVIAADADLSQVSAAAARIAPPCDTVIHFVDDGSLIFLTRAG